MKNILLLLLCGVFSVAVSPVIQILSTIGFDKSAMLQNYADNLIIPGYASLQQKLALSNRCKMPFLLLLQFRGCRFKNGVAALYVQYENVAAFRLAGETELLDIIIFQAVWIINSMREN
jgi:hypothetical protein